MPMPAAGANFRLAGGRLTLGVPAHEPPGSFKLIATPATRRQTQLAMPVTHLLLEQARLRDEAARVS